MRRSLAAAVSMNGTEATFPGLSGSGASREVVALAAGAERGPAAPPDNSSEPVAPGASSDTSSNSLSSSQGARGGGDGAPGTRGARQAAPLGTDPLGVAQEAEAGSPEVDDCDQPRSIPTATCPTSPSISSTHSLGSSPSSGDSSTKGAASRSSRTSDAVAWMTSELCPCITTSCLLISFDSRMTSRSICSRRLCAPLVGRIRPTRTAAAQSVCPTVEAPSTRTTRSPSKGSPSLGSSRWSAASKATVPCPGPAGSTRTLSSTGSPSSG